MSDLWMIVLFNGLSACTDANLNMSEITLLRLCDSLEVRKVNMCPLNHSCHLKKEEQLKVNIHES